MHILILTGQRDEANTNFSQRSVNAPITQNCLRLCWGIRWLYTSILYSVLDIVIWSVLTQKVVLRYVIHVFPHHVWVQKT